MREEEAPETLVMRLRREYAETAKAIPLSSALLVREVARCWASRALSRVPLVIFSLRGALQEPHRQHVCQPLSSHTSSLL
jgi:hypothetical protein